MKVVILSVTASMSYGDSYLKRFVIHRYLFQNRLLDVTHYCNRRQGYHELNIFVVTWTIRSHHEEGSRALRVPYVKYFPLACFLYDEVDARRYIVKSDFMPSTRKQRVIQSLIGKFKILTKISSTCNLCWPSTFYVPGNIWSLSRYPSRRRNPRRLGSKPILSAVPAACKFRNFPSDRA